MSMAGCYGRALITVFIRATGFRVVYLFFFFFFRGMAFKLAGFYLRNCPTGCSSTNSSPSGKKFWLLQMQIQKSLKASFVGEL